MSQFWHSHWLESSFKPKRLQNWEIPRWHEKWPDRHCTTTTPDVYNNGHFLAGKSHHEDPWGHFKGTWEMPLKIDRQTADTLSRSTEYKKAFWKAHKLKHSKLCGTYSVEGKRISKDCQLEKGNNVSNENDNVDG